MGRIDGAAPICFFERFQGLKVKGEQVLVHVSRGHNGHDAVNDLVSGKQDGMFPVKETHLAKGVAL